jgi:hypothetical protein
MQCSFLSNGPVLLESEPPTFQNRTAATNSRIQMAANMPLMTQDGAVGIFKVGLAENEEHSTLQFLLW